MSNNKIYISGRISGIDIDTAKQKFQKAEQFIQQTLGATPINPFHNALPDSAPRKQHLIEDIKLLLQCQAILMLDGWQQSKGAQLEREIAQELEIPILTLTNI